MSDSSTALHERGPVDRFWVVPHTHWDREWYMSLESFRIRLADTVDDMIGLLRDDPTLRFTLDGQTVLLEDYLDVRPGGEAALRQLVAEGRITVGPCYVLPDEYLTGQEALVRNILHGRQVCWRLGMRPSPVGYMPDTFGHVAQLPQILNGFGIDSFIFTRGLGDEADELGALFCWRAPDGSTVLTVPQLGGYGNGQRLGHRTSVARPGQSRGESAFRTLDELLGRFAHRLEQTQLRDVLLCNGIDHDPMQTDISEVLAECRALRPHLEFRLATYEDFVEAVRPRMPELPVFDGELCGGFEENVLRGVNSARMYLKQHNELTERELLTAETVCALAAMSRAGTEAGYRYPIDELRLAWREQLRNQPHDSICGCSVDEVHDDMLQRFRTARQIARQLQLNALQVLAGRAVHWRYGPLDGVLPRPDLAEPRVSVVNTLATQRTRLVELIVPDELEAAETLSASVDGDAVPVQVHSRGDHRWASVAVTVPALRSVSVELAESTDTFGTDAASGDGSPVAIENEHYVVRAADDGTVSVEVRATGVTLDGVLTLVDEGDRGDEYTFNPSERTAAWTSAQARDVRCSVRRSGPVVSELVVELTAELPAAVVADDRQRRTDETVSCAVRHVLRLVAGVERLDVETTVTNLACDHRLRVLVPTLDPGDVVLAEGHFDVVERAPQPHSPDHWHEQAHTTHHTLGGVAWGSTTLLSRGLPEYEALPTHVAAELTGTATQSFLALTLLRCVGWLSREDLATRKGGAGPELPTPGGQCLGTHVFEYALRLGAGPSPTELVTWSADFRTDLLVAEAGIDLAEIVSVDTTCALAAFKGAEDGVGAVMRLYNPDHHAAAPARVSLPGGQIMRARLDEMTSEPPLDGELARDIAPGEIVTLRLVHRPGERASRSLVDLSSEDRGYLVGQAPDQ